MHETKYGSLGLLGSAGGISSSICLQREESPDCSSLDDTEASLTVYGSLLPKNVCTILKAVLAAIVLFVGMYKIQYSGPSARSATESVLSGLVDGTVDSSFKKISIKVYNADYSSEGDVTAFSYPFLSVGLLAEPQRLTTLVASVDDGMYGQCTYEIKLIVGGGPWDEIPGVLPATDFNPAGSLNHTDVAGKRMTTVIFPSPGSYKSTILCKKADNPVSTTRFSEKITVYYIRRELRELRDSDRLDFLHSFEQMLHMGEDLGKKKYGRHYKSIEKFEIMHLDAAGGRHVDHFHDGLGLTTQHMAMSSEFELSMQTIKPHMALPYWDYTIDATEMYLESNISGIPDEEKSLFLNSELFTSKWFGNTNSEANVITKGPFAYQEIPRSYENFTTRSPYGFLRAPWNINPNKYVTRYHKTCGSKVDMDNNGSTSALQWPTCASHFKVTNTQIYDDWYSWAMNIGYSPHGPVHSWIGGLGGMCETDWDWMHDQGWISQDKLYVLKMNAFLLLKDMWRSNYINTPQYCSPDTNVSQCMWICTEGISNESYVKSWFVDAIGLSDDDPNLDKVITRVLCETPFWPGDHLEAGSPVDVSFWPIHPTIERLLQYKDLVRPFENVTWPEDDDETYPVCDYVMSSNCSGHNSYDLTHFRATHYINRSFISESITNEELRRASFPNKGYAMSYVYANFQWDHCEGNFSFKHVDGSLNATSSSALS